MRQRALLDIYPTSRAARCYERIALQLSAAPLVAVDSSYWQNLAQGAAEEVMH
jgi:hypothetical protein